MRIASIDQGTTSTRALIVNTDSKLEIVHSRVLSDKLDVPLVGT